MDHLPISYASFLLVFLGIVSGALYYSWLHISKITFVKGGTVVVVVMSLMIIGNARDVYTSLGFMVVYSGVCLMTFLGLNLKQLGEYYQASMNVQRHGSPSQIDRQKDL